MQLEEFMPALTSRTNLKHALISQLVIIMVLAVLFASLKVGFRAELMNGAELLVYWCGALFLVWGSYLLWSLVCGLIFRTFRCFNLAHIVIGAMAGLLVMEPVFILYVDLFGIGQGLPNRDFFERFQRLHLHVYANIGFIVLWTAMNFLAWAVFTRQVASLFSFHAIKSFFLLPQYWLFADFKQLLLPNSNMPTSRGSNALSADLTLLSSNIPKDKIMALKAEDHYVKIFHKEGEELVYGRLTDAIDFMQGGGVAKGFRTHRSWWVNHLGIDSVSQGKLVWIRLKTGQIVPVSRSYSAVVKNQLSHDV